MFKIKSSGDIVTELKRIADYLQIISENISTKSTGIRSRYRDDKQRDDYTSCVFYPEDEAGDDDDNGADRRPTIKGFESK